MPVDVEAEVLFNRFLSEEYNVIGLAAPAIAERTRPGQFVMVKPSRFPEPLLRRPFSVFEVLKEDDGRPRGISVLNKRIGTGTRLLYDARVGDRLPCLGPLGRSFTPSHPPTEAWMVAGGVGLSPFASLADELRQLGTAMRLFYGARRAGDLFFTEIFERAGARLEISTEDGSRGDRGLVTSLVERAFNALDDHTRVAVYACGPTAMMKSVARLCSPFGRSLEVSLEQTMGCGLGGCYSCVVRVRHGGERPHFVRSCIGGPVFAASDLVWEEL